MNENEIDLNKASEILEEIQAICIGADSPDAIKNSEENPKDELEKCRKDISAISNLVEELQKILFSEE